MIVNTMSFEEIHQELLLDKDAVRTKAVYLLKELRRPALKAKHKTFKRMHEWTSKRNNKWLIFCRYKHKDPLFVVVAYYNDNHGLNGVLLNANDSITHYNSHFLQRYNTRFLKWVDSPQKLDMLKTFIKTNATGYMSYGKQNDDNTTETFTRVKDGICLGYTNHRSGQDCILVNKTFISNDMIHDGQTKDYILSGIRYKQYWDETYKHHDFGDIGYVHDERAQLIAS